MLPVHELPAVVLLAQSALFAMVANITRKQSPHGIFYTIQTLVLSTRDIREVCTQLAVRGGDVQRWGPVRRSTQASLWC